METGFEEILRGEDTRTNHGAKKRRLVFIFGMTGWGKSWLNRERINKGCMREIIMDTMDEHDEAINFDDVAELIEYVCSHKVYCVRTTQPENFDALCGLVMQPGMEGVTLTVEEAYNYFPSRSGMSENAQKLVFQGRHFAVNMNIIFQRIVQCSTDLRSQWDNIITFRQTSPGDIDHLERLSGYRLPGLRDLRPGSCYVIDQEECREMHFAELSEYVAEHLRKTKLKIKADEVDVVEFG